MTGITQATKVKQYTDTKAVNELDLQDALSKLREGDVTLEELNLNNHPDMTEEILTEIVELMKNNTSVKKLLLANTQLKDPLAMVRFHLDKKTEVDTSFFSFNFLSTCKLRNKLISHNFQNILSTAEFLISTLQLIDKFFLLSDANDINHKI